MIEILTILVRFWTKKFTFKPVIDAFAHCRPVISIDATHLYGKYKGCIMVAMTFDANNQILPIVVAYVNEESYATWSYFILNVMIYVIRNRSGVCLVANHHSGIMAAVEGEKVVWKGHGYTHRYCVRHFLDNFKGHFKGDKVLHDLCMMPFGPTKRKKLHGK